MLVIKKTDIKKMAVSAIFLLSAAFQAPLYAKDIDAEIALGKKTAHEIESVWPVDNDPALNARVRMVFNRLVPFTKRSLPYYVTVLDTKELNAFCIPGGGVYVTKGILDFVRSDGELAGILGHELTHGDKNHILIQAERSKKLSLAALAVIIASEGKGAAVFAANAAQIAITNSYSRDLELEADVGGVTLVYKAGYPPAGSLTVLEGLLNEELKKPHRDQGIYMTHPRLQDRIENVLQTIRDNRWPLSRKRSLKLLVPKVSLGEKGLELVMDGEVLWSFEDLCVKDLFDSVAEGLDGVLELETPPYDIYVGDMDGERALIVSGVKIAEEPLPPGLRLDLLRENIVKVLDKAKSSNPMSQYLR